MAGTTPRRRCGRSGWRPWESPSAEDLSRRPLRPTQYAVGKMLFATVTMEPDDDKESLAAFETKVSEYANQSLQSRVLHCDEVQSGNPGLTWMEITPKSAVVCGDSGPLMPVRLLVSPTLCCKLQVMWPLVRTVHTTFVHGSSDESFVALLQQMLPTSPYVPCPGIVDCCQQYGAIHRDVHGLQKICNGSTVLRYESEQCLKWHVPTNQKTRQGSRTYNMCVQCKLLDNRLAKNVATHMVSTPEKIARTLPSSHFPMTYLSPASQKVRIRRLQTERKNLAKKIKKYDHFSVSLGSEQTADLSNIVSIINNDQCIRSELDEILLEADTHKEGHGSVLQDIWDADSVETDEESFHVDQKKNRKFATIH